MTGFMGNIWKQRVEANSSRAAEGFGEFRRSSYFSALDGLRALSILLVLLHHSPGVQKSSFFWTLQENGRYGVGFFFVISGFLICTLFLREESKYGKIDLRKFYSRRFLRLLPLYYAVLLLQALLVFGLHQYTSENQRLFREKLPSYLFYYSNWLPTMTQGPFFCAWSLAVEEQFYIAFGLILFFCRRPAVILIISAALLIKVFVYQLFGAVDAHSQFFLVLFSYREPILLGVLAAFALNTEKGFGILKKWMGTGSVTVSAGVAIAAWLSRHAMQHESAWDSQLLYLLMTIFLIGVVMRPSVPVLGGRVLTHIGKISYGIYLLHMFVGSSVRKLPWGENTWFSFITMSVLTILLASLVYKYFEEPIIKFYKKKFSPGSGTRISPPGEVVTPSVENPGAMQPIPVEASSQIGLKSSL
jgi:peptidoglycan/LPS O-acetylase OafA/YrhL